MLPVAVVRPTTIQYVSGFVNEVIVAHNGQAESDIVGYLAIFIFRCKGAITLFVGVFVS